MVVISDPRTYRDAFGPNKSDLTTPLESEAMCRRGLVPVPILSPILVPFDHLVSEAKLPVVNFL